MRIILEDKKGYGRKSKYIEFADKRDRKMARRNKQARQRLSGAIA